MATEYKNGIRAFHPKTRKAWRTWLEKNHDKESAVYLIMYHKDSDTKSIYYHEAVEEALCFGWIDSTALKRDAESRYQYFTRRKPKSHWSRVNRERVDRLISQGLMTPAGQAMIDLAKEKGTWNLLDDVENEVIPADLQAALRKNKRAHDFFMKFPPSSKRIILLWIQSAKQPATREKRIKETVDMAMRNERANHYQRK
jgi:uncharacterized protein YdeI (YjbR/CyaY-like superfamily)